MSNVVRCRGPGSIPRPGGAAVHGVALWQGGQGGQLQGGDRSTFRGWYPLPALSSSSARSREIESDVTSSSSPFSSGLLGRALYNLQCALVTGSTPKPHTHIEKTQPTVILWIESVTPQPICSSAHQPGGFPVCTYGPNLLGPEHERTCGSTIWYPGTYLQLLPTHWI